MDIKDATKVCEEVDVVGASRRIQKLIGEFYKMSDETYADASHMRTAMLEIAVKLSKENEALAIRHEDWLNGVLYGD